MRLLDWKYGGNIHPKIGGEAPVIIIAGFVGLSNHPAPKGLDFHLEIRYNCRHYRCPGNFKASGKVNLE
jgi:hypothetical protein